VGVAAQACRTSAELACQYWRSGNSVPRKIGDSRSEYCWTICGWYPSDQLMMGRRKLTIWLRDAVVRLAQLYRLGEFVLFDSN
jgi:hypothetical protein